MNAQLESGLVSDKALPGVNRDGQVVHCIVCYPSMRKFLRVFPHLAGQPHTSGYCARHFEEFTAQFRLTHFTPGNN